MKNDRRCGCRVHFEFCLLLDLSECMYYVHKSMSTSLIYMVLWDSPYEYIGTLQPNANTPHIFFLLFLVVAVIVIFIEWHTFYYSILFDVVSNSFSFDSRFSLTESERAWTFFFSLHFAFCLLHGIRSLLMAFSTSFLIG